MTRDVNIKKERRRGMRSLLIIFPIGGLLVCNVKIGEQTVYRSARRKGRSAKPPSAPASRNRP